MSCTYIDEQFLFFVKSMCRFRISISTRVNKCVVLLYLHRVIITFKTRSTGRDNLFYRLRLFINLSSRGKRPQRPIQHQSAPFRTGRRYGNDRLRRRLVFSQAPKQRRRYRKVMSCLDLASVFSLVQTLHVHLGRHGLNFVGRFLDRAGEDNTRRGKRWRFG